MTTESTNESTTVQIDNDVYSQLDDLPAITEKRMTKRAFVNKALDNVIKSAKILKQWFPALEYRKTENDGAFILDEKRGLIVKVIIKNDTWFCDNDHTSSCEHVKFLTFMPDSLVIAKELYERQKT